MQFPSIDKDQRRILQRLRKSGPLSRSALSGALEISGTALTRLSRDLLALGLVEEIPDVDVQRRGRPAIPLRLAARGGYAVGATAHKGLIEIALVDFTGTTITTHHEATEPLDPKAFAHKVRRITHMLVDRHGLLGQRMLGIGIAVPGPALSLAGVSARDVLVDLGCGDGRTLIRAAQTTGARCFGWEINPAVMHGLRVLTCPPHAPR